MGTPCRGFSGIISAATMVVVAECGASTESKGRREKQWETEEAEDYRVRALRMENTAKYIGRFGGSLGLLGCF